jgi:methylthioribose-1-phosphate isomerase
MNSRLGLEGVFEEETLPTLIRRSGMSDWAGDRLRILDRRKLPFSFEFIECQSAGDVADAIRTMVIQGAYSISIAAGYGLALAAHGASLAKIEAAAEMLRATRPTGLALSRMMDAALDAARRERHHPSEAICAITHQAAAALARQGYEAGRSAAELIPNGATILTHCFPDRAYAYMLVAAKEAGKRYNIICSETRPYLQGARLTALVATEMGFRTRVVTDGMGGYLMRQGIVSHFVTAADRVCLDGTVCNKIGSYQYALACADNGKPYVVLRQSGPDPGSATEADIKIEMRDGNEVVEFMGHRTAPDAANGLYPTFDIVPPRLVDLIVTDRGVFAPDGVSGYFDAPVKVPNAVV